MIRSPRFRISPRVHVTWPTSWKAIAEAPSLTWDVVSMQPPIQSAIATASRWASLVVSINPKMSGYLASRRIRAARSIPSSSVAGWPSTRQDGRSSLRPVQEPRLAEVARITGFDDAISFDAQGDVIAEAAADGCMWHPRRWQVQASGHLRGWSSWLISRKSWPVACRVNLYFRGSARHPSVSIALNGGTGAPPPRPRRSPRRCARWPTRLCGNSR